MDKSLNNPFGESIGGFGQPIEGFGVLKEPIERVEIAIEQPEEAQKDFGDLREEDKEAIFKRLEKLEKEGK